NVASCFFAVSYCFSLRIIQIISLSSKSLRSPWDLHHGSLEKSLERDVRSRPQLRRLGRTRRRIFLSWAVSIQPKKPDQFLKYRPALSIPNSRQYRWALLCR